jgi:hypothetical protein
MQGGEDKKMFDQNGRLLEELGVGGKIGNYTI